MPKRIRPVIELICTQCGKLFLRDIYDAKRYDNYFCSKECLGLFNSLNKKTSVEKTCFTCEKIFHRKLSKLNKSDIYFCSKKCQAIAQKADGLNYHNRTGYSAYRRICKEYYPDIICSNCGYAEREKLIECHHIDSNHMNNSKENLMWLCTLCHRAVTIHMATIQHREFIWLE